MNTSEIDNIHSYEIREQSNNINNNSYKIKSIVLNLAIIAGITILVTLLSILFRHIGLHESSIIISYILGVLLVAKFTEGYFYGIAASVVGVLTFNFFFTEPYYTFIAYRADYPVTFIIMLIAAIITSTLTAKVKQESNRSLFREKRAKALNQISKSLLIARTINQIVEVGGNNIAKLFNRSVVISTINSSETLGEPYIYPYKDDERVDIFKTFYEMQAISDVFKTGNPAGAGTDTFADSHAYYLSIKGQSGILGIAGVSCFDKKLLSSEQKTLLEAVTIQIASAIERERLSEKQHKSKIEAEWERLRGDLLRAMSHDLRTPLTGIIGSVSTILDNDAILEKNAKTQLLQGIYEDASWLMNSVENILSITQIDEGKVEIKKNMEAVEEIVAEAASRIKKFAANHTVKINIPDDLIILPMDGMLIERVLVNLFDNAVKYTPYGSIIELKIKNEDKNVSFEITDNGPGIPEEDIPLIFNRFYTSTTINNTARRGTGLGLAICKSIITAHGGRISAYNNPLGGTTFRFELPVKE
jgi:two-component system, OmpR family, sensor histidine kinase KdpD